LKQQIEYSKITYDDLPSIIQIEQQVYPNPWPAKIMQDCLHAEYQCIKGKLESNPDEIACYAFLMIGFEEANLLNISVNPKFQRQSIASQLLHHLLLICRINHAKHLWLEVRESNVAAINLYRQFVFKEIGQRKNYYQYTNSTGQHIKEHAILMSRKVAP
jgi:ribosomal-protein-alanine N-acetyltransferase